MSAGVFLRVIAVSAATIAAACFWLVHAPEPPAPVHALTAASFSSGGRARSYELYVPDTVERPAALLLAFHGAMGDAATIRRRTGYRLETLARREKFVVAYPNGFGGYWNGCRKAARHAANRADVDDVAFARRLVLRLRQSGLVDPNRVYATGFSNGGHMAYRLAVEAPELIAGIAPFAASLPTARNFDCIAAGLPVRTVIVNGTDDPVNPYDGGEVSLFGFRNLGDVRSSKDSADYFRALHGRRGEHRVRAIAAGSQGVSIDEWRSGGVAAVALVTVHGGGHTIPQSVYRFPRFLGATAGSDEIIDYVWQFLDRHPAGSGPPADHLDSAGWSGPRGHRCWSTPTPG